MASKNSTSPKPTYAGAAAAARSLPEPPSSNASSSEPELKSIKFTVTCLPDYVNSWPRFMLYLADLFPEEYLPLVIEDESYKLDDSGEPVLEERPTTISRCKMFDTGHVTRKGETKVGFTGLLPYDPKTVKGYMKKIITKLTSSNPDKRTVTKDGSLGKPLFKLYLRTNTDRQTDRHVWFAIEPENEDRPMRNHRRSKALFDDDE